MFDAGIGYTFTSEAPVVISDATPLANTAIGVADMVDATLDRTVWVYKITHIASGKAYVGLTTQSPPVNRWHNHIADASRSARCKGALHRSIRKYGRAAFEFVVLYEAVCVRESCAVERGLIAQYGTMVPHGFNLTTGGDIQLGSKCSAETRAKISMARKGKFGRRHSPETIAKMRAAKLGKSVMTEDGKERLRQFRRTHKLSAEAIAKRSASMKGRKWSEAARIAITASLRTDEYRKNMSLIKTGQKKPPVSMALREAVRVAQTIRMADKSKRDELARIMTEKFKDEAFRIKHRLACENAWARRRANG